MPKAKPSFDYLNAVIDDSSINLKNCLKTDGLFWAYSNPKQQISQWRYKIKSTIEYYHAQSERAKTELNNSDLFAPTRHRLQILQNAYYNSAEEFRFILEKLGVDASHAVENIFFEKIPRQQTVMAYHQTLFRDWAWGEAEIKAQADLIVPHLKAAKNILVLGAGACGLPIAIHNQLSDSQMLAVDINPILFLTVQDLISEKPVKFTEFPYQPLTTKNCAVEHTLQPKTVRPGFHLALADAQTLSYHEGAFDTLITPWFIDIVPRPFQDLAKHLNHALSLSGRWICLGPLAFERYNLSEIYQVEELKALLEVAGFEIETLKSVKLPYLQSPHSRNSRTEEVVFFSAIKKRDVAKPAPFQYLPDWLTHFDKPVPRTSEIENLHLKTEVYARALRYVDGKQSIDQIIKLFAKDFQMDVGQARELVFNFFVNVYEQKIFREF